MLTTAGFDTATAVGGLTAFSLLGIGGLLALPLFALPTILAGAPVSPGLFHTALLGIAGFVVFARLRGDRAAHRLAAGHGRAGGATGAELADPRPSAAGDRPGQEAA